MIYTVRCPHPEEIPKQYIGTHDPNVPWTCNARLFDARVAWERVSVADSWIVVRCWRCQRPVPLRPTPHPFSEPE